ncbi:MAG: hypothetical protein IKK84_00080 [Clostridia bacterium]|nr:hypothetical protein [Clostridia bacterium]
MKEHKNFYSIKIDEETKKLLDDYKEKVGATITFTIAKAVKEYVHKQGV